MSEQGIVMAVDKGRAVVMLPGGEFRTVPSRGQPLEIGQEIWIPTRTRWRKGWAAAVPAAAMLGGILYAQIGPHAPPARADAVLSVDINPSINLDVSPRGTVFKAAALDAGGRTLLRQKPVLGLTVDKAVRQLLAQAAEDGYFKPKTPTVLIGAVFARAPERWFNGLDSVASEALHHDHVHAAVVTVSKVSAPLVQAMQTPSVSVGRYLLWQRDPQRQRDHWSLSAVGHMPVSQLVGSVMHLPNPKKHMPVYGNKDKAKDSLPPLRSSPHAGIFPSHPVATPSVVVPAPEHPGRTKPIKERSPSGLRFSAHASHSSSAAKAHGRKEHHGKRSSAAPSTLHSRGNLVNTVSRPANQPGVRQKRNLPSGRRSNR